MNADVVEVHENACAVAVLDQTGTVEGQASGQSRAAMARDIIRRIGGDENVNVASELAAAGQLGSVQFNFFNGAEILRIPAIAAVKVGTELQESGAGNL